MVCANSLKLTIATISLVGALSDLAFTRLKMMVLSLHRSHAFIVGTRAQMAAVVELDHVNIAETPYDYRQDHHVVRQCLLRHE